MINNNTPHEHHPEAKPQTLIDLMCLAFHPELKYTERLLQRLNQLKQRREGLPDVLQQDGYFAVQLVNLTDTITDKSQAQLALAPPEPSQNAIEWANATHAYLNAKPNRFCIALGDPLYPLSFYQLKDPPLVIFGEGDLSICQHQSVAMVGSRNATKNGLNTAHTMAEAFVKQHWAVISGMAEGIDGAAHLGALAAHGRTIAVLGCGPDVIYPKHHQKLYQNILENGGLVLSEYPPGTEPLPTFFPRRNRLVAALGDALLVVEAALKSGSLITANLASQMAKPVFAVPGSIHSSQSKGCHWMIKNGAGLAETIQDVLTEAQARKPEYKQASRFFRVSPSHNIPTVSTDEGETPNHLSDSLDSTCLALFKLMNHHPIHTDTLAQAAKINSDAALSALTELELLGLAVCETGNRWALSASVKR